MPPREPILLIDGIAPEVGVETGSRPLLRPSVPPQSPLPGHGPQPSGRDLQWAGDAAGTVAPVVQLGLPGFGRPAQPRSRRPARPAGRAPQLPDAGDPLVGAYLRRLRSRGAAPKGIAAYRYQIRAILAVGSRLAGRPIGIAELFGDPELLGRALADEVAPTRGHRLSKWTLAQRRCAARSLAGLLRPELRELLGAEPLGVLDEALRRVAERVGGGYRLGGGAPRRRGGPLPSAADVTVLLEALGRAPGFRGHRDRAFFAILAATGARVNALRTLDGAACVWMPNGRLRLFLREKGKAEPREVELGGEAAQALRAYIAAFNREAAARRWAGRVRLGEPGPIWRNSGRGRWPYTDVLATLRAACAAAGLPAYAPHALRRAFATAAAAALPRHVVALAGGWRGLERLDDHYIRPHAASVAEKLARLGARDVRPAIEEIRAAAPPVPHGVA